MSLEKLQKMKEKIDSAKSKIASAEGQKEYFFKQLWSDWKCKNLEEAQKKLQELVKKIEDLEEKIQSGLNQISAEYAEL